MIPSIVVNGYAGGLRGLESKQLPPTLRSNINHRFRIYGGSYGQALERFPVGTLQSMSKLFVPQKLKYLFIYYSLTQLEQSSLTGPSFMGILSTVMQH